MCYKEGKEIDIYMNTLIKNHLGQILIAFSVLFLGSVLLFNQLKESQTLTSPANTQKEQTKTKEPAKTEETKITTLPPVTQTTTPPTNTTPDYSSALSALKKLQNAASQVALVQVPQMLTDAKTELNSCLLRAAVYKISDPQLYSTTLQFCNDSYNSSIKTASEMGKEYTAKLQEILRLTDAFKSGHPTQADKNALSNFSF